MSRKEKQFHYIYKTVDTRNGNFYIGMHSTDDPNDGYIGSGDRLKKLIYKHGKEIFKMEILEFLPDRKSLKIREAELVNSELLKEEKCMNLKPGGYGGLNNEEHRKKFFEAAKKDAPNRGMKGQISLRKKIKEDPNFKEKYYKKQLEAISKFHKSGKAKYGTFTGKKHKEESKKKMSQRKMGENNPQYGMMWITNEKESKRIKKYEQIPSGWRKGRKIGL
jgi:hypothetical protein